MAADYRVRPSNVPIEHVDKANPIRFTARDDDFARYLYGRGVSALIAKGMPVMPMTLERFDPIIGTDKGVWVEVRTTEA